MMELLMTYVLDGEMQCVTESDRLTLCMFSCPIGGGEFEKGTMGTGLGTDARLKSESNC